MRHILFTWNSTVQNSTFLAMSPFLFGEVSFCAIFLPGFCHLVRIFDFVLLEHFDLVAFFVVLLSVFLDWRFCVIFDENCRITHGDGINQ